MDKEPGLLELVMEKDSGKNVMFKDRRTGKVMALASTLNLINKDPELQAQYRIKKIDGNIFIQSKKHVENLD